MAKEKGLEGLANIILLQMTTTPLETEAESYLSEEKGVATVQEAIAGAMDILRRAYPMKQIIAPGSEIRH